MRLAVFAFSRNAGMNKRGQRGTCHRRETANTGAKRKEPAAPLTGPPPRHDPRAVTRGGKAQDRAPSDQNDLHVAKMPQVRSSLCLLKSVVEFRLLRASRASFSLEVHGPARERKAWN